MTQILSPFCGGDDKVLDWGVPPDYHQTGGPPPSLLQIRRTFMSGGSGGGDATHVRRESDLRSELVLSPPKRMQSIMLPATAQGDGRMNVTNYSEVSVVFFLDTMASVWA